MKLLILLSIVLTLAVTGKPPVASAPRYCDAVAQFKDVNLPANRTDDATDIAHGSAIFAHGIFAGFMFRTRAGALWYEDGIIAKNAVSANIANDVIAALGLHARGTGKGGFIPFGAVRLDGVIDGSISLEPCF